MRLHKWLREATDMRHVLLLPGMQWRVTSGTSCTSQRLEIQAFFFFFTLHLPQSSASNRRTHNARFPHHLRELHHSHRRNALSACPTFDADWGWQMHGKGKSKEETAMKTTFDFLLLIVTLYPQPPDECMPCSPCSHAGLKICLFTCCSFQLETSDNRRESKKKGALWTSLTFWSHFPLSRVLSRPFYFYLKKKKGFNSIYLQKILL